MAGSLSDMGLTEKHLLELANVDSIRQGTLKDASFFHPSSQKCTVLEEVPMRDGLLFKFCVRPTDGQSAVQVWMHGREVLFALQGQPKS